MTITIGQQLGSYEITALLGKGGMGEVYRAKDTKLKRDVAIKILPEEFSLDPERVSRFQREAEALAALNHQNIGAIYDLQQADDTRFLILELVEGETLADLLAKRGALPVEDVLNIAKQIGEALEAAHEKGVVHRDLKPANIKVTPEGKARATPIRFNITNLLAGCDYRVFKWLRQGKRGIPDSV
jgi:eukaryotic-like serine/threonine-protein kinase